MSRDQIKARNLFARRSGLNLSKHLLELCISALLELLSSEVKCLRSWIVRCWTDCEVCRPSCHFVIFFPTQVELSRWNDSQLFITLHYPECTLQLQQFKSCCSCEMQLWMIISNWIITFKTTYNVNVWMTFESEQCWLYSVAVVLQSSVTPPLSCRCERPLISSREWSWPPLMWLWTME